MWSWEGGNRKVISIEKNILFSEEKKETIGLILMQ
jgi:hypothetical protein